MRHRIVWVDMLRGFCILAILWFHTEMYYAGHEVTPYALYVDNALAAFFFLSGYLFYSGTKINVRHKLYGVFRWLFVPYLFFTVVLALPKALAHQSFQGFDTLATDILTGQASWYVSALIVAELLFITALHFLKKATVWMVILAVIMLVAAALFANKRSLLHNEFNFWHVNEAMLGYFLMTMGYFFHQYERAVTKVLFSRMGFVVLVILYAFSKYIILSTNTDVIFGPIIVSNFYLFIADLIVSVLLLVCVFMKLPFMPILSWIGKRSIVYYFICGGVPFVVGRLLIRAGFPYSGFFHFIAAFAMVCLFSTAIVWLVYRYTHIVRRPTE